MFVVRVLICLLLFFYSCRNSPDISPEQPTEEEPIVLIEGDLRAESSEEKESHAERDRNPATAALQPELLIAEGEGFVANNQGFKAVIDWVERSVPLAYENSTAVITIARADGMPAQSVEVKEIKVWMKIHGHGLGNYEPILEFSDKESSKIYFRDIFFIMPGPWEINLTLKVDGVTDYLEYPVEVGE